MRYYQCKCGESQWWGSIPPSACIWCEKCQSNPAGGPSGHRERIDHEFIETSVETDDGPRVLSRCRYCMMTKKQIAEQRGKSGA